MIRLLILCLLLITSNISAAPPPQFEWNETQHVGNLKINSMSKLLKKDILTISKIYEKSIHIFFSDYENLDITNCALGKLTINVISEETLNDTSLFGKYGINVFGRYYWKVDTVFITHEVFEHHDFLAHELAHHFYDACSIFRGVEEEERHAYEFQNVYLQLEGIR